MCLSVNLLIICFLHSNLGEIVWEYSVLFGISKCERNRKNEAVKIFKELGECNLKKIK